MNNTPEYQELVLISQTLQQEYLHENAMWRGSPFEWIRHRPSRSIGAIGEKIVSMWLAMHDFSVSRSPDSDADRIVENMRVEIKFSTLWESGTYVFQQIRDQSYDFIILLGISPHDAHCWVLRKEDIIRLWKEEHQIGGQHTGQGGGDTAWIHVTPQNEGFLSPYGNDLPKALELVSDITGYNPQTLTECFNQ